MVGLASHPPGESVVFAPAAGRHEPLCQNCVHFHNDAATIEAAVPGLGSLGSAHACVRADDGLCLKHDRFVTQGSNCRFFRPQLRSAGRAG